MDEFAEMAGASERGEAHRGTSVALAPRSGRRPDPVDLVRNLERDGRAVPLVRPPAPRLGGLSSPCTEFYAFVMKTPDEDHDRASRPRRGSVARRSDDPHR